MSKKNIQELRDMSPVEMNEKVIALRHKLIEARLQASSGRLEKPSFIKNSKREIARIFTIKKEMKDKNGKNK